MNKWVWEEKDDINYEGITRILFFIMSYLPIMSL